MTNPPLPPSGNEERWNGQRTVPVDASGSHPPRLFPHPPIVGYGPAQAGNFQRPLAPPVFVQNQFTDTYGLPQNHFPGLRFRANEHRYRVPPVFPPSSNSTEGLRSFVQNMSHLNDDGHHHRASSMPPLRRPPHWEDDPYAASSFRESDAAGDRGVFPGPHGHCCQSELHHYHRHPVYAGAPSSFCGDGHRSPHHPGFWTCNGYPHHCTYGNSCGSPCANSDNRRNSTLTYIGPPTCGGNGHCGHCLPSCGHVTPVVPSSQPQTQLNTEDTILPAGRISREQPSGDTRNGWGDVGRWLGKRLSAAKRVIPKTFKPSNTRRQTEDDFERPQEPDSHATATLNPSSSPSEAVPTVATTSSQIGENSNISSETTTGLNPSSSGDDTTAIHDESIPRPISSASTCQCNPSTVTLHRMLQHKPFDTFELQWNITLPPKGFVFWASTPEEILSGRPVSFPDDALFSEFATTPPMRHMFINALGDFPLERCQGDPDPSRSKDKERHMYASPGIFNGT
ncbi:hypothetical protein AGABI2DRAFT_194375, partial [Agaricus bisporus var. bisporus H97]|uniref:hypothetical protein n=1 Tax=Agaricus bisporus var. bisporus (strain H97 / ATCC MYA-4626 / FGSC 10389) TaxID=936046 RepID=UPI00029F788A